MNIGTKEIPASQTLPPRFNQSLESVHIKMKKETLAIIAIALVAWMVLVNKADNQRGELSQREIAMHCNKVDLGNGTFVCE